MRKNPKKSVKKKFLSKQKDLFFLTIEELLEVFPEPEECLDEVEKAFEEGLKIVKTKESKKKFPENFIFPEVEESETVKESIRWYLNQIGQVPRLTLSEEKEIGLLALQGNKEARERMINSNLRLVVTIAKRFKNRGLSFLDLIQAGNFGLIKAVEKFDPRKQLRFGIYAIPFIKEAIWKAVRRQGYLMKMPRDQAEKIRKVEKARIELVQEKGRWPTLDEISAVSGVDLEEVEQIVKLASSLISLDKEIDEDGQRLLDQLKFEAESSEKRLFGLGEEIHLEGLIERLDEIEQKILTLHYGLSGTRPKSLEEISDLIGISVEQIFNIENQAIEKMKAMLDDEENI